MTRRMVRFVWAGIILSSPCRTGPRAAAGWADGLFAEKAHNFGPVPRGAKVKHDFVLTNRLAEPITILNLRPSCGCTSGKASASTVNPGEQAVVEAQMDTRNFLGLKSTILYVTLVTASGREAEVRLGVTSNILADIVLNPGSIDFGTVMKGQSPTQVLTIDRINAPGWRFERMVSASRALTAQLAETRRDPKGGVELHAHRGHQARRPRGPAPRRDPAPEQRPRDPEHPGHGHGHGPRGPDRRAFGARPRRGGLGRRQAGPFHRPRLAALRHHRGRRGRRRLLGRPSRERPQDDCTS